MGLPNKQIGWSQESNLLWEVLRQVTILGKSISTSSGGSQNLQQVLNVGYTAKSPNETSDIEIRLENDNPFFQTTITTIAGTSNIRLEPDLLEIRNTDGSDVKAIILEGSNLIIQNEDGITNNAIKLVIPSCIGLAPQQYTIPSDNEGGNYIVADRKWVTNNVINPQFLITDFHSSFEFITYTDDLDPIHSFSLPLMATWEGKQKTFINMSSGTITITTYALTAEIYNQGTDSIDWVLAPGENVRMYNNGIKFVIL